MQKIEEMLGCIQSKILKNNILVFYKTVEIYMKEFPSDLQSKAPLALPPSHSLISEKLYDFTQRVMSFAMGIYSTILINNENDFSLDDLIVVAFASRLDVIARCSRVQYGKQIDFVDIQEYVQDPCALIVSLLAKEGIYLSDQQIHALSFRDGGWSEHRKARPDISKMAAVLHASYLLALRFSVVKKESKKIEEIL